MKKLILFALMAMVYSSASAQNVQKALHELDAFVDSVTISEETTKEQMDSLNTRYGRLKDEYKKCKSEATLDEIEEYSRITTKYKKKASEYYANRTGETLDGVADNVAKWTNKQYRKIKGMIKGVK